MERASGERVRAYTIERKLGDGGQSIVYLAHRPDGAEVALIEVLDGPGSEDAARYARLSGLIGRSHPHLVTLHEMFEERSAYFVVLEYVPGAPLHELLASRGALSVKEAGRLLLGVLDGLECLHGLGVIHRDLKPANIIVRGGEAVIVDLGASGTNHGGKRVTKHCVPLTYAYASPEQFTSIDVDARADLYAVGVIGYEVLSGIGPSQQQVDERFLRALATTGHYGPHYVFVGDRKRLRGTFARLVTGTLVGKRTQFDLFRAHGR